MTTTIDRLAAALKEIEETDVLRDGDNPADWPARYAERLIHFPGLVVRFNSGDGFSGFGEFPKLEDF